MIIALLLASAVPTASPPVQVAPVDPTARFKGDSTALKFDPSCRDYTLDTVIAAPLCAARVSKGEAAPSIAIAVKTLSTTPARAQEAIQVLERAATATDSPAVHYLLGTLFGAGERVTPDYAKAVKHLTTAAERGNPAAADLLATLLVAGKGTLRNVPRAIRLYETAAANGFPNSAVALGKLYLAGRHVKKDEVRGRAWLDAAAAVGVPSAISLAALAKNDGKVNNFQLFPAADPKLVKMVRYGTFDNPDIPPNFGFDLDFQAMHDTPYDDPAVLWKLESSATSMPTPYLYELARRIAARDPERALRTYLLARTRMTYDASRCADPAAMEALRAWDLLLIPDIQFLFTQQRPAPEQIEAVLVQEAKFPDNMEPWWVCRSGMAAMTAAMKGDAGPLKVKPTSDWPALRAAARAQLTTISH